MSDKGERKAPLSEKEAALPQVDRKTRIFIDPEGRRHATTTHIASLLGVSEGMISGKVKAHNPPAIDGRDSGGHKTRLYELGFFEGLPDLKPLPKVNSETNIYTDPSGKNFVTSAQFKGEHDVKPETLKTFGFVIQETSGKDAIGHTRTLYCVEDLLVALEKYLKLPCVVQGKWESDEGELWVVESRLVGLGIYLESIAEYLGEIRSQPARTERSHSVALFHLEDVKRAYVKYLLKEMEVKNPEGKEACLVELEEGIETYTSKDSVEYKTIESLCKELGTKYGVIHRLRLDKKVHKIFGKYPKKKPKILFEAEGVKNLVKDRRDLPKAQKVDGIYIDPNQRKFITANAFQEAHGAAIDTLGSFKAIPSISGLDGGGHLTSLYDLDAALKAKRELDELPTLIKVESANIVSRIPAKVLPYAQKFALSELRFAYVDDSNEVWTSQGQLKDMGVNNFSAFLKTELGQMMEKKPAKDYGGHVTVLYRLTQILEVLHERKSPVSERKRMEALLEEQLIAFLKNIMNGETKESLQFHSLIRVLGAARSVDILFSLHPKFKDIPIETVRGLLSEYLGETLLMAATGGVADLEALEALPKLEKSVEQEFKGALTETIKDHCYKYYVAQKRTGSKKSAHDILDDYLNNLEAELRSIQTANGKEADAKTLLDHPLVGDAVVAVLEYFQEIWAIELPDRVAASLKDGREFPDLAQRMNIKEVQDKKRMLIADEMGMGKSASAILSHEAAIQKAKKEGQVLGPALILVPSNVLDTWRRYLSSDNANGGCFKPGMEPKVVEIESPTYFAQVDGADYVIMTQERLNQRYQAVSETQWSTIIVDEMHKLKSADGVRSSLLRTTAQRQKLDDRLVLLSGTPIPNTVRDVAVALILLHPEQFKDTDPAVLAGQIIRGDLVEIRKYLMPRMQAKSLAESVDLPPLKEGELTFNLPPDEALLYKTFVEEGDELDRLSKLHFLRKWLLDPSLVDQQPDGNRAKKGEKARRLEARINQAFDEGATHIVMFVNDVVDGILRPSKDIQGSRALVERIKLPADVKTAVIHGDVLPMERVNIQKAFQSGEGRFVLYVSGNTADVGVDYSAGSTTLFLNEPWTEYARQQQRSRVYRPGVRNAVTVESLITLGTVEQGIHEYVQRKYHAVEKLLRGIPLTDIEKEMLEKEEGGGSDEVLSNEVAEQYLSAWDRLMHLFSASREIGEKNFQRFVERHGKEYADLYKEFRARSFAGNVNRVCGAVVKAYAGGMDRGSKPKVLDAASGPEMLRRALPEELAENVTSMDLNPSMFSSASEGPTVTGGLTEMPFEKESFDVVTASLCLHYTGFQPRKGVIDRVEAFEEMQRVLKVGGWAVLALAPGKPLKNPEQFKTVMQLLGFEVVEEFTGPVHTYDNAFQLPLITLRKRENVEPKEDLQKWVNEVIAEYPEAFGFERGKRAGRHPRKMFGTCVIETNLQGAPTSLPIHIPMKEGDQQIYEEEKSLLQQARNLKGVFRDMRLIPVHALEQHNFSRVRMDNGSYALYAPFTTTQSGLLIGEGVWRNL